MGKERFGRYRGRWNVCAGSVEDCDQGCLVSACLRELREEFKLQLDEDTWQRCTQRIFWIASTMVAVLRPPPRLDVHALDMENARVLQDDNVPPTYKEMERIGWISANDVVTPMSSLARYIVRRHHHQDTDLRAARAAAPGGCRRALVPTLPRVPPPYAPSRGSGFDKRRDGGYHATETARQLFLSERGNVWRQQPADATVENLER